MQYSLFNNKQSTIYSTWWDDPIILDESHVDQGEIIDASTRYQLQVDAHVETSCVIVTIVTR